MTLPASGQISLIDIFEEMKGYSHTDELISLVDMYDDSTLTTKSSDIKTSDFYSYTRAQSITLSQGSETVNYDWGIKNLVAELSANYDWSVTSMPSWVNTVTPNTGTATEDESLAVNVDENESESSRQGTITFKLDSYSNEISLTLTQLGNEIS